MTKQELNIGILSCWLLLFIQGIAGIIEIIHYDNKTIILIMNMMNMFFNISIFMILWRVLVKFYRQTQLDWLIKSMIVMLIIIAILTIVIEFKMIKLILYILAGLSFINLILCFVFFNKILDIDIFEIKQIQYLKYYSLTFIICVLGQFILSILAELKNKDLKYLSHFLSLIPVIFIVIFFRKIKNEI